MRFPQMKNVVSCDPSTDKEILLCLRLNKIQEKEKHQSEGNLNPKDDPTPPAKLLLIASHTQVAFQEQRQDDREAPEDEEHPAVEYLQICY
jgi:hypothetical protein